MSDEDLRRLERRLAQGEDVILQLRTLQARAGLPLRDPFRNPLPGDVIRTAWDVSKRLILIKRRVVDCAEFHPFAKKIISNRKECSGRVHWLREEGCGPRFGLILLRTWRGWASGASILAYGAP